MRSLSVVVVYNAKGDLLLLVKRRQAPYMGLYDFVGSQCERDESALVCAYRALSETAGIGRDEIDLSHVMDFAYHTTQWCVQVFAGQLEQDVKLCADGPPLEWKKADENYFDTSLYAGEGYMGHILSHMRMQLFAPGQ